MEITIREMQEDEATLVQKIGRSSFGFVERLFFDKPKNALVAVMDGEIVGATAYKIFSAKDHQKIGYVTFAFVKRGCEGKGIANAGQVCMKPQRLYVHESITDQFVEEPKSFTEKLIVGDPSDPKTNIGPMVSEKEVEKTLKRGDDGWAQFRNKYRKGVTGFSCPLFTADKGKCVVFRSYSCGSLCGEGACFIYKKIKGNWVLVKVIPDWIS